MPEVTAIELRQRSRTLYVEFEDGTQQELSHEFLRVYSPSAEVRGHGPGQETLVTGKREVAVTRIEPVGNYAVMLEFSDGHNTGLYSWDYLHGIARRRDALWEDYLQRLAQAGAGRDA